VSRSYFRIAFPSDIYKVKSIIINTVEFIRQNLPSANENDLYDLRLIYSELICNAVIHGNKNDLHKYVSLFVEVEENNVYSIISDEGRGFDYKNLPVGAPSEKYLSNERGRGIMLVRSLSDSMAFSENGNRIEFHKKVNDNGQNINCR